MAETFQIRDVFNPRTVTELGERLKKAWNKFDQKNFCETVISKLPEQTYSERWKHIAELLKTYLPDDFPQAVDILLKAQLPKYESDVLENTNDRFITVPLTAYISQNGLEYYDLSMQALYEMTQRLTAEWDIRIFIEKYPKKTMALLKKWAKDENPHVRRLVSEGSRPYLPWGKKLTAFEANPKPTLELLEILRNDPSEYVRRSVANHLNDHSKKHPDIVVKTLARWKKEFPHKNMERLIKHATRTLIKNGDSGALELLGFKKGAKVKVENLKVPKKVAIGDTLIFSFDLISTGKEIQPIVIDYVIHFQKADGSLSPKVFKLSTKKIKPEEVISFEKKQSFKIITTRKYHTGKHALGIQVNGEEKEKVEFLLTT